MQQHAEVLEHIALGAALCPAAIAALHDGRDLVVPDAASGIEQVAGSFHRGVEPFAIQSRQGLQPRAGVGRRLRIAGDGEVVTPIAVGFGREDERAAIGNAHGAERALPAGKRIQRLLLEAAVGRLVVLAGQGMARDALVLGVLPMPRIVPKAKAVETDRSSMNVVAASVVFTSGTPVGGVMGTGF